MKHILFLLLLTGVCMPEASAQDKGRLTGGLESNSIYYVKDSKLKDGSSVYPTIISVAITT